MSHPKTIKEAQGLAAGEQPGRIYNRLLTLSFLGDGLVIFGALVLAFWLRFKTGLSLLGTPDLASLTLYDYFGHYLVGLGIMLAILTNFRLYERRNFLSFQRSSWIIFKSGVVWIAIYLGLSLILKFNPEISRVYGGVSLVTVLGMMWLWRWTLWHIFQHDSYSSRLRQRALVIGWNPEFDRAFKLFGRTSNRYFDVCGVVKPPHGKLACDLPEGVHVIGRHEDLPVLLKMKVCDVVLVADAHFRNGELSTVASSTLR